MKINKRLASYPILLKNDDDYVDSSFDADLEETKNFDRLMLDVKFALINEGLETLIHDGKAVYAVHLECPLLCYRKMLVTPEKELRHDIDMNDVANSVEVSTFIVANEDIPQYYNEKFNWEYGKSGVDITKGNILAIGPTFTVDVNRSKDGLKKLTDIIRIKQYDREERAETKVVLDGDVILIYTNKLIKDKYYSYGREYLYNIISMIFVPAMVYVLTSMKNYSDTYSDYRWYSVIEQLLNQNGVEVHQLRDDESDGKYSIHMLAQKIFKAPIEKGILELEKERGA